MTPTMEEVAGWLREAADDHALRASFSRTASGALTHQAKEREYSDRAAQVEALRTLKTCDTCLYWATSSWTTLPEIGICNFPEKKNALSQGLVYQCGPKFGCVHHEDKQ